MDVKQDARFRQSVACHMRFDPLTWELNNYPESSVQRRQAENFRALVRVEL